MRDVHVHFLHGSKGGGTDELLEGFIAAAQRAGLDELRLLEHTHHFFEFEQVYAPVKAFSEYQRHWLSGRMIGSVEEYLNFIRAVRGKKFPIEVKFGLEVCYIPETADKLADILDEYDFDFLTGSVHWIDGWGVDHPRQKESWNHVNIMTRF